MIKLFGIDIFTHMAAHVAALCRNGALKTNSLSSAQDAEG